MQSKIPVSMILIHKQVLCHYSQELGCTGQHISTYWYTGLQPFPVTDFLWCNTGSKNLTCSFKHGYIPTSLPSIFPWFPSISVILYLLLLTIYILRHISFFLHTVSWCRLVSSASFVWLPNQYVEVCSKCFEYCCWVINTPECVEIVTEIFEETVHIPLPCICTIGMKLELRCITLNKVQL